MATPKFSKSLSDQAQAQLLALQAEWLQKHAQLWQGVWQPAQQGQAPAVPPPVPTTDRRFSAPAWNASPLHQHLHQAYLLNVDFIQRAAAHMPVDNDKQRSQLDYLTRQWLDALAPSNFFATNPEFVEKAIATKGESIKRGIDNLLADLQRGHISMTDESLFEVGRNIAATDGAVIFENELIQLIQYTPTTAKVAKRPFLMVPPCINKFYILDLQAENSFVRHAVDQGNTVFLISWRNVQAEHGHFTWDDYLEKGPLAALDVVREICKVDQVNALGFCVGGTILSSALAVAKARGDDPVASLTLLTTLLDFSDAGEIGCLVDEDSVRMREESIGKGGLLRGQELATVFSSLRANDLIWQYVVNNYLKGETPPAFDLLYWNSDATNLPGPFLAWYLRNLYLENRLRERGDLRMCGVPADLKQLDMPVFFYASREDHIVPWKTSYLGRELIGGKSTFVLGASGHIAGVINPPAKNKRNYWLNDAAAKTADDWLAGAESHPGSWWTVWSHWLAGFADGQCAARKKLGNANYPVREAAPGRYVRERA